MNTTTNDNNTKQKVTVFENYGPLKRGLLYTITKEGYDYFLIKTHGANICVPKNLVNFDTTPPENTWENDYIDDEWDGQIF